MVGIISSQECLFWFLRTVLFSLSVCLVYKMSDNNEKCPLCSYAGG